MELPAFKLPQIDLPFDVPTLLHPPIDHFVIAIPVLVLIIEIINLVLKKRAIGVLTFFMLLLGMIVAIAAYLTGTVDGKEAYDALSQAGQSELKEHKLLGTYLMLFSGVVVLFKLFSAMARKGLVKAIYLLVLIVFVAGILKQGKDGGELVYEYGANVERVKALDDELFDCKDELSDAEDELKDAAQSEKSSSAPTKETAVSETTPASDTTATTESKVNSSSEDSSTSAKDLPENAIEKVDSEPEAVKIETH